MWDVSASVTAGHLMCDGVKSVFPTGQISSNSKTNDAYIYKIRAQDRSGECTSTDDGKYQN